MNAGRKKLVHQALLFGEGQEDVDAYVEAVALVRALLVGLLATAVGYEGPIVGWEKKNRRDYDTAPSSWRPTSDGCLADATTRYAADIGDVESDRQLLTEAHV